MKTTLPIIFVILSLVACSTAPKGTAVSPVPTISVTKILPTATKLITTLLPTEPPTFYIEKLPSRTVSLSQLGLKDTTRILVFDPKSEQVLSVSNQSIAPIPNIQSGAVSQLNGIEMSPDHHWFAYLEINQGFNIRISSVDGNQYFEGIKNAVGSSFDWLSNDKIAVYNKLGFWKECPSEMQIFDPFTKVVNKIPYISTSSSPYCFPIPYFNSDLSQALYLDRETGWQIYNYKTKMYYSVLPGLNTSPGGDKYFFKWGTNGLSFAIPAPDKITFALNLSEEELTSAQPLEMVELPKDTFNENSIFDVWIPEKHLVGFDLSTKDKKTIFDCSISQTYVMIDLANKTLRNYCLNRSIFSEQTGSPWFTYVSSDYRFVGWTIHELPSNAEPLGAVILDTKTGNNCYLEGYEILGFGEISP